MTLERFMELLGYGQYDVEFECFVPTPFYYSMDVVNLGRAQYWYNIYMGR